MYLITTYVMIRVLTKISLKRSHNSMFLNGKFNRFKIPFSKSGKGVRCKDLWLRRLIISCFQIYEQRESDPKLAKP